MFDMHLSHFTKSFRGRAVQGPSTHEDVVIRFERPFQEGFFLYPDRTRLPDLWALFGAVSTHSTGQQQENGSPAL